jgi:acyl-CoA reductase-like NAD-dependent aldehyde dehydrogenase
LRGSWRAEAASAKDARLFIGGEWLARQTLVPVIDEYTRKDVAEAHVADRELAERAVDAAKRAFNSSAISIPDRSPSSARRDTPND